MGREASNTTVHAAPPDESGFLKRNLPPPRKYCLCREPLLARRSLVRRQFLLTHAPWKIFIPHSTTTMANTSVAAVNTSKEATLIQLLRFPSPTSGLVDSIHPLQSRDERPLTTGTRCGVRRTRH